MQRGKNAIIQQKLGKLFVYTSFVVLHRCMYAESVPVFQLAPQDPGVKREKPGEPSAEGASFERRRPEDRGAEGAEGGRVVGCGEAVSPSSQPPSKKFFSIFELKKTTFGAFWVLFLQLNGNWLGH